MYLKEIKARGFKSFADNISIKLDKGLTGIVGPNGSGKSNVVDAVRWVLGEQSVKSLRGDGTMSDVIFSGSKSRKPMNVAVVSLIFDNTDHFLPLEYDEVEIKRRVYRDGTNEYFLNENKVRLKDISNLLLDSGIAKESFNIISQGKIESIISSRPADRRVIIEEAAGVLKYKRRKEEALRKLDKTNNNINRVGDIVKELESRIEPLKEAKEKALNYKKYQEELENIEIALITEEITNINYEYQTGKEKIDILNNELLELNTLNTQNEVEIEKYKNELIKIENAIKNTQNDVLELTTKVEKLNGQKNIITERQKYQVSDTKIHQNLLELTENELQTKNEINNIETDIININKQIENLTVKENELNKVIKNTKTEKNKLEFALTSEIRKQNSLKIKRDNLISSIENGGALPKAVKAVLDNPKLRGIHDALGNLVDTEEKYSKAITTALGYASNYIITSDEKSAKEAMGYLKNIGRATFFPLNIIKGKYIEQNILNRLKNYKGYIGIAKDLVKNSEKYNNIVGNCLGNIIVTDNIDNATEIAKEINYRYRLVTLDGEIIHVGGSMTGGKAVSTHNIISEKYELENLLNDFNKVIENIKSKENKINEIDYQLKSHEDKLYLLNKEKRLLNDDILNKQEKIKLAKSNLEKIQLDIRGMKNLLNGVLSDEEEAVIKKYYEAVKEKSEALKKLDVLLKNKEEVSKASEEYALSVKQDNKILNNKNNELKELEVSVNRLDVKLDTLLATLSEEYSMSYENAKSRYKLEIDYNIAKNKVTTLRRKIKELGEVNLTAPKEYDELEQRYNFLSKQIEDLLKAKDTLITIADEMDKVMVREFKESFKIINELFAKTFKELFKGGHANLKLTDPNNLLETGIEIVASPPGKKVGSISLLSGGEKTLTAISLLFAIIKARPAPFCILDEVEAALDEANVDTFGKYVTSLKNLSQFIIITHKKVTMEYVDVLYGITMQESGVSKLVSVKLTNNEELL